MKLNILLETHIGHLNSGWQKSQKAKDLIKGIRDGKETFYVNGVNYAGDGGVTGSKLEKGMILLASYNSSNQGANLIEILGFTDDDKKYGEGGVKFSSVKELLSAKNVKTLKELEELQDKKEYGYRSYLVVKDLADGDEGAWFYLYKGRWVRGSGAEPLTFTKLKEVHRASGKVTYAEAMSATTVDKYSRDIDCRHLGISSLEGAPEEVAGDFRCDYNKLTDLVGAPKRVYNFTCGHNPLTSLKGAPEKIENMFIADNCKLENLKNVHKYIKECYQIRIVSPIKSHVLGVFMIKGLAGVSFSGFNKSHLVTDIINKHLKNGRSALSTCQNELIEAGLEEYAQI